MRYQVMAKPSTAEIVREMLSRTAAHYRKIGDVSTFQAISPYRAVIVEDEVSRMSPPLSAEFTERRLYVMNGSLQLASVDLAFHADRGLVNFSLFLVPREWFKRKAIKDCVQFAVFPYLRQNYPNAPMVPVAENNFLFPDPDSGLTFQLRTHLDATAFLGIGVAIIDSDFV